MSSEFLRSLRAAADAGSLQAIYRLEKSSLTTPEATARLARALGVRAGEVVHAGMKDKHALTTQHVSVRAKNSSSADRFTSRVEAPGMRATLLGWSTAPIDASMLDANRFEIVVRDLTRQASERMARHAAALMLTPDSLLITNYFGEQRFGSARHHQGFAAAHLVRGDFESALRLLIATPARKDTGARRALTRAAAGHWGRWHDLLASAPASPLRRSIETLASGGSFAEAFAALPMIEQRMCVDAYQSWLWNKAAAEFVRRAFGGDSPAVVEVGTDFGALMFVRASDVPPEMARLVTSLPRKGASIEGRWADAVDIVLESEGLILDSVEIPSLRRPRFDRGDRALFVRASNFSLSPPVPDAFAKGRLARTVSFCLPSGAYATTLLRSLGQ